LAFANGSLDGSTVYRDYAFPYRSWQGDGYNEIVTIDYYGIALLWVFLLTPVYRFTSKFVGLPNAKWLLCVVYAAISNPFTHRSEKFMDIFLYWFIPNFLLMGVSFVKGLFLLVCSFIKIFTITSEYKYQSDKQYAQSKRDRKMRRERTANEKKHKQKSIDEAIARSKRVDRLVREIESIESTLDRLAEESESIDLYCITETNQDDPYVSNIINKVHKINGTIRKRANRLAKLSQELKIATERRDHSFDHLLKYNSGTSSILDALLDAIPHIGNKTKIALGVYSEFMNFMRCRTNKDYVDLCISIISRFLPSDVIDDNVTKLKEILQSKIRCDTRMKEQSLKSLMDMPNKPITKILKHILGIVVVLCMSLGLIRKENLPDIIEFGLELPKKVNAVEIISYITKAVSFCASTLPFYDGKTRWQDLFNGTTINQIIAEETCVLSRQHLLWKSGDPNENSFASEPAKLPLNQCYGRAVALRQKLLAEIKHKRGSEAAILRSELVRVNHWEQFFLEKFNEEEYVVPPFFLVFLGTPGVGKTTLQRYLAKLVAKNNGHPYGENDMCAINFDDKFQSRGWHSIFTIDDYHQCKENMRQINESMWVIRACNVQRMMANSADLESKGREPLQPNVLCLNSNELVLRPEDDITDSNAFLRRISLEFTDIEVKPEYQKRGSTTLDASRVIEKDASDIWLFKMGFYNIKNDGNRSRAVKMFYCKDFSTTDDPNKAYKFQLSEVVNFVIDESRRHYASNAEIKDRMSAIGSEWHDHEVDGKMRHYYPSLCPICKPPSLMRGNTEPIIQLDTSGNDELNSIANNEVDNILENHNQGLFQISVWFVGFFYYMTPFRKVFDKIPVSVRARIHSFLVGYVLGMTLVFLFKVMWFFPTYTKIGKFLGDRIRLILANEISRTYGNAKNKIYYFVSKNKVMIGLVIGIAAVLGCYSMCYQGVEETVSFGNKPDTWKANNVNYDILLNDAVTTNYDAVIHRVKNGLVSFKAYYSDGVISSGNAMPYKGYYYLFNQHYLPPGRIPKNIVITRYDSSSPQSRYVQTISEDFIFRIPDSDIAVVFMPKAMRNNDFSAFFTSRFPNLPVKCHQYHKKGDGFVEEAIVTATPMPCRVLDKQLDYCFTYSRNCFEGLCGSPIVSISKRPVILGLHWAGNEANSGSACFVNKIDVEAGIAIIEQKTGIKHGASINNIKLQGSAGGKPLDGKNSFHFLPTEGTLTYIDKSDNPVSNNKKNCVEPTELLEEVRSRFDFPMPRGPHVEENWRPFYEAQLNMCHSGIPDFSWGVLHMAKQDLMASYLRDEKFFIDIVSLRPLSLQEAMDGTKVPGEEPMVLNTSIGNSPYSWMGKKNVFFDRDPITGITTAPDNFEEIIRHLEDSYSSGFSDGMALVNVVKQEVLLKKKARVFSVNDVCNLVLLRKFFLTFCSLTRRHNTTCENVIGINVYGTDWDEFVNNMKRFGDDTCGDGDYSNFDQSMRCIEILLAFSIIITICEKSGNFSKRDIAIMWGLAHEVANPTYEANGCFFAASGTLPSGLPLTTVLNNVVNQLRFRYAYYKNDTSLAKPIFEIGMSPMELRVANPDLFPNNVGLFTHGDDNIFSVRPGCDFGMTTMKIEMGKVGVNYTDPSKNIVAERQYKHYSELTFLKRSISVVPEITDKFVAPLDIRSIWKPVMMHVKSKALTNNQLLAIAIDNALMELFYHGRDTFTRELEWLSKIVVGRDVERFLDPNVFRGFDQRIWEWRDKFCQ